MIVRLAFVLIGIPRMGMLAYLWGMLASELLLSSLHLISLKRLVPFRWDPLNMLVKPAAFLMISIGIYLALFDLYRFKTGFSLFIETGVHIMFLCVCYGGLLMLFHKKR